MCKKNPHREHAAWHAILQAPICQPVCLMPFNDGNYSVLHIIGHVYHGYQYSSIPPIIFPDQGELIAFSCLQ